VRLHPVELHLSHAAYNHFRGVQAVSGGNEEDRECWVSESPRGLVKDVNGDV